MDPMTFAAGAMPLRVAEIADGLGNQAAGTSMMIRRLSQELARLGHEVAILSTGEAPAPLPGVVQRAAAIDFTALPGLGRLRLSRRLASEIDSAARAGAVLHNHGLWRMANVYPARAARRHRAPLVFSPHGMMSDAALAFSPRQKALFGALAQRRALAAVTCFHATSPDEAAEIRRFGCRQPVAVIPNGIDLPANGEPARETMRGAAAMRTVLYLGRLHPIKALDRLLAAWARVEATHAAWQLRLVGPSEGGHGEELRALAARLGLQRVRFDDGLYGAEKEAAYRAASVLVLPSLSENFGVVVAEALASGTPVIASKGTPWQGLLSERCGWWVEHGVEPLAAALAEAMAAPAEDLAAMGGRGRAWMARDYAWPSIATAMAEVYRWCALGGERPATLIVD